jgi:general secretion pathway protein J
MKSTRGFTLIELMIALVVLSLLALMSYRGLGAVLDARDHVRQETDKWRNVASFLARFDRDVELAAPRTVRTADGQAPAWLGIPAGTDTAASLVFSRFATADGVDTPRRVGYQLNDKHEIVLSLWPGLDVAPDAQPARYPVLTGVKSFELQYLNRALVWVDAWPSASTDPPIPRAVRVRIVLDTNEEIVRIFALQT